MKILIYKRTHKGDPDLTGIFGIQDCMGRVRDWDYDAVIGIGGKAPWNEDKDIRFKINWIGLGPKKIQGSDRGSAVVFSNFALFEENGEDIEVNFPHLFNYMYGSRKRFDMSSALPENVFKEVEYILDSVKNYPASPDYNTSRTDYIVTQKHTTTRCGGCFQGRNLEIDIDG
ncbi:hypothetical protein ACHRVK_03740 [Flavobacterium plurextorum]|uniref:hypothetical protein n=1 Tax=Flavobacterium plurextorum TaxID=1114867 RepID=UPI0037563C56